MEIQTAQQVLQVDVEVRNLYVDCRTGRGIELS